MTQLVTEVRKPPYHESSRGSVSQLHLQSSLVLFTLRQCDLYSLMDQIRGLYIQRTHESCQCLSAIDSGGLIQSDGLGRTGSATSLVLPSGGMAVRRRKCATADRLFSHRIGTLILNSVVDDTGGNGPIAQSGVIVYENDHFKCVAVDSQTEVPSPPMLGCIPSAFQLFSE
ncbi:hypothetical protein T265_04903 [Opisthorchis viverrini]|uniref:Uncharacterized protein n=1 Tax=Opisthorchis viverrini TaxID=6198 RepID=A0A074ZLK6_OPIVI|nr:hypothetical protein T265_04903 [Opisthorchis viverrini]KER28228.1 hypothetical protein T265_04903 [Opisthorchis viverrini]